MTQKIKISEIFNNYQGEAYHLGVSSLFVRTFGCNFKCEGFSMPRGEKSVERFNILPENLAKYDDASLVSSGCDAYMSWDPRFKDFSPMLEIPAIVDRIQELLPLKTFSTDQHMILTGGEPLLGWQKAYPALFDEIYNRNLGLTDLTFETNGTQFLNEELYSYLNNAKFKTTFSISAKLPCSGQTWEESILPDRIIQYQSVKNSIAYLKFVAATHEDLEDAKKATKEYRDAGFTGPVYIMPVGGVESVYHLNERTVADLAISYGFRFSPRIQVALYANAWNK